jgi:hypothetical protein
VHLSTSNFRKKERARELDVKRSAREDEDYKRGERDAKRTARKNAHYRNKERERELDASTNC